MKYLGHYLSAFVVTLISGHLVHAIARFELAVEYLEGKPTDANNPETKTKNLDPEKLWTQTCVPIQSEEVPLADRDIITGITFYPAIGVSKVYRPGLERPEYIVHADNPAGFIFFDSMKTCEDGVRLGELYTEIIANPMKATLDFKSEVQTYMPTGVPLGPNDPDDRVGLNVGTERRRTYLQGKYTAVQIVSPGEAAALMERYEGRRPLVKVEIMGTWQYDEHAGQYIW